MKKYLVGGYCRDRLMGLKPKDKDYVIVGANESDIKYLESAGYKQVGVDFPVYLSPKGNEFALARVERKTGNGYGGFTVETKGVTLEEDLSRRDLTINSIAYEPLMGIHIDPFKGRDDIKNKILRHTSSAFSEDPLRVLRLARFATRFQDFTIHSDTEQMVIDMVQSGETDYLVPDRVYVEFKKAFSEEKPGRFIKVLNDIGYIPKVLPKFKCTKKNIELIDYISMNCTEQWKDYFIWSVLLQDEITNIESKIRVPQKYIKFSSFVDRMKENIKTFRKKSVEEMCDILFDMNIKNNGGEEFLYKVLEYFILRKEIDVDLEDLIIKVYDRYDSTVIPDIQEMVKTGELDPKDIRDFVQNTRYHEIKKMFI
ncbi:hypothetical protein [Klebsiella phage phiKp_21]|uniref:tRNA nucleotidyltransferase n=2 Tax=Alcyoneusvirus TaxID=2560086 RepID=A0A0A8JBK7_BPK64|nr:tRNA nucleotidyltransferase [Klebsiella phage vB_KleM_RaK2]YP_010842920.1 tRNA nucleotidyltransferase [Klebsiella phage K64-1]QOE32440.1 multifunctional tRNA nucleotidyl transferase/2,3-cyclic phosphodiesterase/2-nucleotidase/phosphatase [Klebsiella phage Muenster]BEH88005.1 hypothetical protein [Klebsiella phage phiKp_21]AFA44304.1 hypothetical protein RaK2_00031 [Klebsiella phage vB_KleM_RaK2]BAQ02782.1 hypothetical protein [Klebsiella phage K64-1]